MQLQRGGLAESLMKWNLKSPTTIFRLPKSESSPARVPKYRVFSFESVDSGEDADDACKSHVPKGYLAVYVGSEERRFIIPLGYLNHSIFRALLKKAEEEFGFSSNGGIRLPCESLLFEHILWLLKNKDPMLQNLEMEELLGFYHEDDKHSF
ncbi:auxin-induced protein 6B-like [Nymphaea colorata]|nr:auxin-induced protein 6B-like [Nymphaea colorata]